MEFRKMLMITLYAEQKKKHRFIEQSSKILLNFNNSEVFQETYF